MTEESVLVFEISGDAGLRVAKELAASLAQALANSQSVSIATAAITSADITTIQLLVAARKQALAAGKLLALTAAPTGVLRDLLIQTGCLDASGLPLTPDGALWISPALQDKGMAA